MDHLSVSDEIQAMTKKAKKSWCLGDLGVLVVQKQKPEKQVGRVGRVGRNAPLYFDRAMRFDSNAVS
jgi:hypothetical protein